MTNNKAISKLFQFARVIGGVGLLFLLFYIVDVDEIVVLVSNIDPLYLFLASTALFFAFVIGALNFFILFSKSYNVEVWPYARCYWIAWSAGLLVPGQIGDMAAISIWLKSNGVPLPRSIAYTLIDKLVSLVCIALFGGFGITIFLGYNDFLLNLSIFLAFPIVFFTSLFIAKKNLTLFGTKKKVIKVVYWMLYVIALSPSRYAINYFLTIIKVILTGACFWLLLKGLGLNDASFFTTVTMVSAAMLVAYIPISVNGMGTVEWAGVFLFDQVGIESPLVISIFILFRVINLVLALIPSSLFIAIYKKESSVSIN